MDPDNFVAPDGSGGFVVVVDGQVQDSTGLTQNQAENLFNQQYQGVYGVQPASSPAPVITPAKCYFPYWPFGEIPCGGEANPVPQNTSYQSGSQSGVSNMATGTNAATPCPGSDQITAAEAACLMGKKPDILTLFQGGGWDISAANYQTIACHWWYNSALSSHASNKTLGSYLVDNGCRSGGTSPTPSPSDSLAKATAWAKANPIPAGIGALVLLKMFKII